MKEHKILIKIHKQISKKVEDYKPNSDIVLGLTIAKEIVRSEIEANKERKNIHHKDIQKSSKSESRKKVHSV